MIRAFLYFESGGRGIRTPGSVTYDSFQDCSIKPLWHSSEAKVMLFFLLSLFFLDFFKKIIQILDFQIQKKLFETLKFLKLINKL